MVYLELKKVILEVYKINSSTEVRHKHAHLLLRKAILSSLKSQQFTADANTLFFHEMNITEFTSVAVAL